MAFRRSLTVMVISSMLAATVCGLAPVVLMQARCLAILILAASWWIFEPCPAYVTSLFLVPLTVLSGVLSKSAAESAQIATISFYDPTIFVFMTGFTLASACEKYKLTHRLSSPIIAHMNKISSSDFRFYVTISLFCVVVCGVLSNVAGSVLVSAIGRSLNRDPSRLFLTIAFACNIGGMIVPIASPQNIIALLSLRDASEGLLTITWFQWTSFSIPFCLCAVLIEYFILKLYFRSHSRSQTYERVADDDDENSTFSHEWTVEQITVLILLVWTISGWCLFEQIWAPIFGHMGVFGLFSIVLFHVSGLLNTHDFQALPWSVLAVLGGGIVLGKAVETSGLLDSLSHAIAHQIDEYHIWVVCAIFFAIISVIANFFSSTVCAIIFFPLISKIGITLNHPNLLLIGAAFMTSGAMGLPVSSFPNANAAATLGVNSKKPILTSNDFACTGFPIAFALLVLLLAGSSIFLI